MVSEHYLTNNASYCITSNELERPPTKYDYKALKHLLSDFYITITIPQFQTIGELQRWQCQTILRRLEA